jgi:hypothetical protein
MTRNARTKQFRKEILEEYLIYLDIYFEKENQRILLSKNLSLYDSSKNRYLDFSNHRMTSVKYCNFQCIKNVSKIRKMFKAYENPESEIILKKKRHSWKNILKLYNTKLNKQLKISKMKAKRY